MENCPEGAKEIFFPAVGLLDLDRRIAASCRNGRDDPVEYHPDSGRLDPFQMVGFCVLVRPVLCRSRKSTMVPGASKNSSPGGKYYFLYKIPVFFSWGFFSFYCDTAENVLHCTQHVFFRRKEKGECSMRKIAIVTDSNSGITQDEGRGLGVFVLPMPFYINEVMYLEGITLSQEEFYERLQKDETISTSQPSPGEVCGMWDNLLKEYDEIVHIPMSSGLSASCETAMGLARDYDGKVQVVDNQRISVTQRQSVLDALALVKAGKNAAEIREILEAEKLESSIYITLETLKYLKKGGRITPAAAAIGTVLNLKPVLQIQGDKLDAYSKVRGKKQAKRVMLKAMKEDMDTRFAEYAKKGEMCLQMAYTGNREEAEEFKKEVQEMFPELEIHMDPLSLSVACHIGHGALAVACSKKVTV